MKYIAIIGGTGSTGKELIKLVLESNYIVTSVKRNSKQENSDKLKVIKGGVTDLESLIEAFKGIDIVISCFGPSNHKIISK